LAAACRMPMSFLNLEVSVIALIDYRSIIVG